MRVFGQLQDMSTRAARAAARTAGAASIRLAARTAPAAPDLGSSIFSSSPGSGLALGSRLPRSAPSSELQERHVFAVCCFVFCSPCVLFVCWSAVVVHLFQFITFSQYMHLHVLVHFFEHKQIEPVSTDAHARCFFAGRNFATLPLLRFTWRFAACSSPASISSTSSDKDVTNSSRLGGSGKSCICACIKASGSMSEDVGSKLPCKRLRSND